MLSASSRCFLYIYILFVRIRLIRVRFYFLYFLLNRSECEPVFSITRMSSWSCCSSFYLLDQIVQTVVLVHTSLVEVAQ